LVWRFDRFARSTKHLLLALEEFRSLGVQFISYQENIDTSSPLGQALFTIVSAVAQLERDLIRERVSAGVRNARACGKELGRPRRIVDHDRLVRMKAEGASLRQIAEAGRDAIHLPSLFWSAWRFWHFWQRLLVAVAGSLWHRTQTPALTSRS
jgi:DNA invertase Pin-like site-specific DNA recombinase